MRKYFDMCKLFILYVCVYLQQKIISQLLATSLIYERLQMSCTVYKFAILTDVETL
jgi:hypothetical protein